MCWLPLHPCPLARLLCRRGASSPALDRWESPSVAVIQVALFLHKVPGQMPVTVEMLGGIWYQSIWGTGEGTVMLEVTFGNLEAVVTEGLG